MITIRQIAKIAGVSRGTVDRALNNRPGVNPETAARIKAIAKEQGFIPSEPAKQLAALRKKINIEVVFPGRKVAYFAPILKGLRKEAKRLEAYGVTVNFTEIDSLDMGELMEIYKQVEERHPDGVVTVAFGYPEITQILKRMSDNNTAIVFVNTVDINIKPLCFVGPDDVKTGRIAAGLLAIIAKKDEKVGVIVSNQPRVVSYEERINGLEQEMAESYPDIQLVYCGIKVRNNNSADSKKNCKIVEEFIRSNPEISTIYLMNSEDKAILRSIHKAAAERYISIITNDWTNVQRELIKEGNIAACIGEDVHLQGKLPLEILYNYLALAQEPVEEKIYIDSKIYLKQNV